MMYIQGTMHTLSKNSKVNCKCILSNEFIFNNIAKKDKINIIMWQIISLIGLNLAYIFVISKEFYYSGFRYEFDLFKILFGIFILVMVISIGYKISKPYYYAVWNIMFLYLLGGEVVYYQYNPGANFTQILVIIVSLIFLYILSKIDIKFKKTPDKKKNIDIFISLITIILFVPFVIFFYKYINLKNLLLIDIYKTRIIFRNLHNSYSGYAIASLARILLPVLIVDKLRKKQHFSMTIYINVIISLFMWGSKKYIFWLNSNSIFL